MKKVFSMIRLGDFVKVSGEKRAYMVHGINGDGTADVIYLRLNELGDDVLVYKKTVRIGALTHIHESNLNLTGYFMYIRSLILDGEDIFCYAS